MKNGWTPYISIPMGTLLVGLLAWHVKLSSDFAGHLMSPAHHRAGERLNDLEANVSQIALHQENIRTMLNGLIARDLSTKADLSSHHRESELLYKELEKELSRMDKRLTTAAERIHQILKRWETWP